VGDGDAGAGSQEDERGPGGGTTQVPEPARAAD
jgi:transcriptional repressor NrdR